MMRLIRKSLLALALLGIPAPLVAQGQTDGATPSGVSFTQPKDWSVAANGPATIFAAPEADLHIAVVDAGSAPDAQAAAAKAWAIYRPAMARPVQLVTPRARKPPPLLRARFRIRCSPVRPSLRRALAA